MLSIIEIAFALSAAAYIVLLVTVLVYYANNKREQQEIAKLNIGWPIFENLSKD
jgi:uncharacterized protein (UPF0212 family)